MIDFELLNDGTLIKQWSTLGVKLLQTETGELYDDPVDIYPCYYHYTESDIPIQPGDEKNITDEEFFDMLEEIL